MMLISANKRNQNKSLLTPETRASSLKLNYEWVLIRTETLFNPAQLESDVCLWTQWRGKQPEAYFLLRGSACTSAPLIFHVQEGSGRRSAGNRKSFQNKAGILFRIRARLCLTSCWAAEMSTRTGPVRTRTPAPPSAVGAALWRTITACKHQDVPESPMETLPARPTPPSLPGSP